MGPDRTSVQQLHAPGQPGRRGLSIIETMIGLAIGLLLVALMLRGFASVTSSSAVNSGVSEYQTNGRYAMDVLKRELRHTALSPLVWDANQLIATDAAKAKDFGCGAGLTPDVVGGLSASDGSNAYTANCLSTELTDRAYLRGDVLTVRRVGLDNVSTFQTNAPYARVSYGAGSVFLGGETPPALAVPAFDHPVVTNVYYINSFTNSASETPLVPALYRLRLGTGINPVMTPELVASNVEHMRLQFAVLNSSGSVRYVAQSDVTDWTAVVAVRVWLLLRSTLQEPGLAQGSFTLGDITYAPNDAYRRTVLSATMSLRNR